MPHAIAYRAENPGEGMILPLRRFASQGARQGMENSTCMFTASNGPIASRLGQNKAPQYISVLLLGASGVARSTIL